MLKRLELVGFKSFADKTRFAFPAGITADRRPERVRQEQRRRRGPVDPRRAERQEPARRRDGRRHLQRLASPQEPRPGRGDARRSTTPRRLLATDADGGAGHPPRLPRRQRRIPHQRPACPASRTSRSCSSAAAPARRVHASSSRAGSTRCCRRPRRTAAAIFEEAAGISRFKAKKDETLRKLEHTDENLTPAARHSRRSRGTTSPRPARCGEGTQVPGVQRPASRPAAGHRAPRVPRADRTIECRRRPASTRLRGEMSASAMQVAVWEPRAASSKNRCASTDAEIAANTDELSEIRQLIATFQERQVHEAGKADGIDAELEDRADVRLICPSSFASWKLRRSRAGRTWRRPRARPTSAAPARRTGCGSGRNREGTRGSPKRVQDGRDRQFHLVGRAAALNSEAASASSHLEKLQRERDRKRAAERRQGRRTGGPSSAYSTHSATRTPTFRIASHSPARPSPIAAKNATHIAPSRPAGRGAR